MNEMHPQFDACFGPYRRSDPGLAPELPPESQQLMFLDKNVLHREAFTRRCLYTEQPLHTAAFTQRSIYTYYLFHSERMEKERDLQVAILS